MRNFLSLIFILAISTNVFTQNYWTDVSTSQITNLQEEHNNPLPHDYRIVNLDFENLKTYLNDAPIEFTEAARNNPLVLTLPLPDGSTESFHIMKSSIMEQELADKFLEIKTFTLQGVEDGTATGRMNFNANNFHAYILSARGSILIDPAGDHYISFYKKNKYIPKGIRPECGHEQHDGDIDHATLRTTSSVGEELRTYRLAVATTGGFASYHGGTVNSVMAALVNIIDRLNTVYERDIAARMILVANNDELIFLDDANDPYTQGNTGAMINENPPIINNIIGLGNYDIGHVFDDGGGGLAQLQSVCSMNGKARGVTGIFPPTGDLMAIDYASHEVGHQFGGNHTFNNCGGNENQGTGFEPGSGSTIMSYSGLCGSNNVQFASDDYLHGITVQEMLSFIDAGGINCAVTIPTNNTPPTVEIIDGGFNIPMSTPFELTAISTDAEGDALTYCWEQFNSGPQVPLGVPSGNVPLYRTISPSVSPTRVFPAIERIIANDLFSPMEYTPDYARGLSFNVTVRDNNAGAGGIAFDGLNFDVTDSAGPFLVTNPNTSTSWEVGEWLEVNWDVANTDNNTVNCQSVNIKLSVDGGFTYPHTLTMGTPNNGSAFVSVPNVLTNQARVRVEAADNIFFDISNMNFSIVPPTQPGFAYYLTPNFQEVCLPNNVAIDIITDSLLGYNTALDYNITSTIPTGVIANFSSNPALPSDGSVLTLDMSGYTFSDTFDVTIEAIAPGVDTSYRTVTVRTVGNNFSALDLQSPADGQTGISELHQFTWNAAQSADQYFVQIATSPSFESSTIHAEAITADTFYSPPVQLDISTPYYWRVRGSNECGDQDFLSTKSFHTIVFACDRFENNNSETIPSTGQATIENKITVNSGGMISDLNVAKIKGNHSNMNHIDVSLISPAGTEVVLFTNTCLVSTTFDFGLDDESASNILCPPLNGAMFLPQNPLSVFDGEDAVGEWTLKTQVNNTAGNGGKIQQFHLELCSDVSLNAPYLVKNDVMPVPPAQSRAVTDDFLIVQDDDNTPSELEYTLVTAPQHGQLFFLGNPIGLGDHFRQSSINAGGVTYLHNGDNNAIDDFSFTVTDGEGGFIGTPQFNIEIDPDLILDVNDLLQDHEISIFPNPNNGDFNILFEKTIVKDLKVSMYNVHGQLILQKQFEGGTPNFAIEAPHLSDGIYFVKLETEHGFLVKKMVVK